MHHPAVVARQLQGMVQFLDDPGPAQQASDERRIWRLRLDEAVGAAHDSRQAGQIGLRRPRRPCRPSCHTKPTRPAKREAF